MFKIVAVVKNLKNGDVSKTVVALFETYNDAVEAMKSYKNRLFRNIKEFFYVETAPKKV